MKYLQMNSILALNNSRELDIPLHTPSETISILCSLISLQSLLSNNSS